MQPVNHHSSELRLSEVTPGTWLIIDANSIIHSGTQDWMEAAFDYMTKSLSELTREYPEISEAELQESIQKWSRPYSGSLILIQVSTIHTDPSNT